LMIAGLQNHTLCRRQRWLDGFIRTGVFKGSLPSAQNSFTKCDRSDFRTEVV
jgi:hypothetical protein